jgi:hypothetical protein
VVALLIGGMALWLHHSGYESGVADTKAELGKADDANRTCVPTLAEQKLSLAQCETNRLVDQVADLKAQAARDKQQLASDKAFEVLQAQLHEKMTHECADWAKQPACGSFP